MQFKELVQLEEFRAYRQAEISAAADFLHQIWVKGDPQYIRGALDAIGKVLKVPESFAVAQETKEFVGTLINRDFADFEVKFLRKHLVEEE